MKKEKIKEILTRHGLCFDDAEEIVVAVQELMELYRNEIKENEPYATRTIHDIEIGINRLDGLRSEITPAMEVEITCEEDEESQHKELLENFKEYCREEYGKRKSEMDKRYQGKHLICSNSLDFRLMNEYECAHGYLIDEYPDVFDECTSIDECDSALDRYYEEISIDVARENLDKQLEYPIVVLADLGFWNGRRKGYRIIHSKNLKDVFDFEKGCEVCTWWVDLKAGTLCSEQHHHDGTHYLQYYLCKDVDKFENAYYYNKDYMKYLENLGNEVVC